MTDVIPDDGQTWYAMESRNRQAWLTYLAQFPPEAYISAQHVCRWARDAHHERDCRIVYNVYGPWWVLQPVAGDPYDEWADDRSLEDIWGGDAAGIIIRFCPGCGQGLPPLELDTCLDPWREASR